VGAVWANPILHDFVIHVIFDVMAAVVFLIAVYLSWVCRFPQEMTALADKTSGRYFASIGLGAVIGSYFFGSFNSFLTGDFAISRSIVGGLAGAIVAVEAWKIKRGLYISTGYIYALPLALMVAVGRFGCALSGLGDNTYGIPTGTAWGWNFGDGILRHPVALYEIGSMIILAMFLFFALWKNAKWYPQYAFYIFAGLYGTQRFVWEFFKPYPPLLWNLNVFQFLCLGMVLYALYFSAAFKRQQRIMRNSTRIFFGELLSIIGGFIALLGGSCALLLITIENGGSQADLGWPFLPVLIGMVIYLSGRFIQQEPIFSDMALITIGVISTFLSGSYLILMFVYDEFKYLGLFSVLLLIGLLMCGAWRMRCHYYYLTDEIADDENISAEDIGKK
jgi:prolipoprotein diacylglyceryltransferase